MKIKKQPILIVLVLLISLFFFGAAFLKEHLSDSKELRIERPEFGKGAEEYLLYVKGDGELFNGDYTVDLVKKEADWIQVISKEYHPEAYQKRNAWMVNKASKIIALCNGEQSGTLNTVRYAEAQKVSVHMIQV